MYAVVEQKYDGYLGGVGRTLAKFLQSVQLVNWIQVSRYSQENVVACNGFGDLVAQFIKKNKSSMVVQADPHATSEYTYHVTYTARGIRVLVKSYNWEDEGIEMCCEISIDEFLEMCTGIPLIKPHIPLHKLCIHSQVPVVQG